MDESLRPGILNVQPYQSTQAFVHSASIGMWFLQPRMKTTAAELLQW